MPKLRRKNFLKHVNYLNDFLPLGFKITIEIELSP